MTDTIDTIESKLSNIDINDNKKQKNNKKIKINH